MSTEKSIFTSATYSPEDNKLRIYATERLSPELFQRFRDHGFSYANKQQLFVAPRWSVAREDFCLEFVDEIVAEGTTVAERALAKADRLEKLSEKRFSEANSFQLAANELQIRMSGQPSLAGHHSFSKTQRAEESLERSEAKASDMLSRSNYWLDRATGVERYANMKNNWSTRYGRIKTLLKELRTVQRDLNHAFICKKLWTKIDAITDEEKKIKNVLHYVYSYLATGVTCSRSIDKDYRDGVIDHQVVIERAKAEAEYVINSSINARILNHVLNRLGYERELLGVVGRFDGKLTATILKAFARENGAHKPNCQKVDGAWEISSFVPLPLHIQPNCLEYITLEDEDFVELMYQSGYSVPAPKPKAASTLNFKAKSVKVNLHGTIKDAEQITLTKAEYQEIYSDYRGIKLSECGLFKVRICKNPKVQGEGWAKTWVCVFLSDSKKHIAPITESITFEKEEVAA